MRGTQHRNIPVPTTLASMVTCLVVVDIRIDIGKCAVLLPRRIDGYATALLAPALMLPTQRLWSARLMVAAPKPLPLSPVLMVTWPDRLSAEVGGAGIQARQFAHEGHSACCQNIAGDIHRVAFIKSSSPGPGTTGNIRNPLDWRLHYSRRLCQVSAMGTGRRVVAIRVVRAGSGRPAIAGSLDLSGLRPPEIRGVFSRQITPLT